MIISKTKIWKAALPKNAEGREPIKGVHYNGEKKRLEAANGFILAVCPVSLAEDERAKTGIVPAETVKEAYDLGRAKSRTPTLEEDNGNFTPGRVAAFPQENAEAETAKGKTRPAIDHLFPNVDQIIPTIKDDFEHILTIDAKLLLTLAEAICEDEGNRGSPDQFAVRLYKDKTGVYSPVIVKPGYGSDVTNGNFGLIMPIQDNYAPKA